MGSNNYAEVITDTVEAQKVVAAFERLVRLGRQFKALEFDPDTDRFAISCGRESNFPPHPDVENGGATLAPENARALWKNRDTVAVSFGNGLLGLICQNDGRYRMLIPAATATADLSDNSQVSVPPGSQKCQFGFVLSGSHCDRPGTQILRAGWFYYPDPDWNIPLCADHKSAVLAMPCERWLHDSSFERKERVVDRSRTSGAPAAGLISWDCELGHDEECDQIGCPGYELMPACARCLRIRTITRSTTATANDRREKWRIFAKPKSL